MPTFVNALIRAVLDRNLALFGQICVVIPTIWLNMDSTKIDVKQQQKHSWHHLFG